MKKYILSTVFFIVTIISCNEDKSTLVTPQQPSTPTNFSLQKFDNSIIREHLHVDWDKNITVTLGNQDYDVYHANLDIDMTITQKNYSEKMQYYILSKSLENTYYVMTSHAKLESPTQNPFDSAFIGYSTIYDVKGKYVDFLKYKNGKIKLLNADSVIHYHPTTARVQDCGGTFQLYYTDYYIDWYVQNRRFLDLP